MPRNITDPNVVVEGLARIFYYGLRKEEMGRLSEAFASGRRALSGKDCYWWWKGGAACPTILASGEVPEGGLNTYSVPVYAQLTPAHMMIYDRAQQLHKRLKKTGKRLGLDYWDLFSTANPREVRRATQLAAIEE